MKNFRLAAARFACTWLLLPALLAGGSAVAQETGPSMPSQDDSATAFGQSADIRLFIDQMAAKHGFARNELEATFSQVHYQKKAVRLVKPAPPGKPKNWQAYRARFVEPVRINAGVKFWNRHASDLARAEKQYGVPAEIIVAIIGVESIYGRHTGNFRVLDTLATLAFDYPDVPKRAARMAFFRDELENALLLARESGVDPLSLRGSYAGAIGWAQFMPGSIRQYGVDFDHDGKIDLRESPTDAIGSIANYLTRHGWQNGEPIAFPAHLNSSAQNRLESLLNKGLKATFWPADLEVAGVTSTVELPTNIRFGLVDLQNGSEPTEYWLGTANFFAIAKYNRSYFYAMSVADLGRAVRAARNADLNGVQAAAEAEAEQPD
ncbi:MAG: lytic murein transglycosylase B [Burkholderiaceae bacterium]|nr:lytic murein transglycosylase B [Burkholderiaceae bacterium]